MLTKFCNAARAVRAEWEAKVEAPTSRASERLARARFAAYGDSVYPDATGTLRLTYGKIAYGDFTISAPSMDDERPLDLPGLHNIVAFHAGLRAEHACVLPGYHMNKQHWNTVLLDKSVPDNEVKRMIEQSYQLVVNTLPKAKRPLLRSS